ncbi:hypothetical protein AtEden1_Chr1g0057871 [Arabidopsis thaliana]
MFCYIFYRCYNTCVLTNHSLKIVCLFKLMVMEGHGRERRHRGRRSRVVRYLVHSHFVLRFSQILKRFTQHLQPHVELDL